MRPASSPRCEAKAWPISTGSTSLPIGWRCPGTPATRAGKGAAELADAGETFMSAYPDLVT